MALGGFHENTCRALCTVPGKEKVFINCGIVSIMNQDVQLEVSTEAPSY